MRRTAISLAILGLTFASPLAAQPRQDPASLLAAQRQAMAAFARMDGVWRGPAWSITPTGRHLARGRVPGRGQRAANADFRNDPPARRHHRLARRRRGADALTPTGGFVDAAGVLVAGGCHRGKICYGSRLRDSASPGAALR